MAGKEDPTESGTRSVIEVLFIYFQKFLLWIISLAWLQCSCSTANRPVELARKLLNRSCERPSAALCK